MGHIGDLVVVTKGLTYRSAGLPPTAKWDIVLNPLGRITKVNRHYERSSGGWRTTSYKVEPVDPKVGFGALYFHPSDLRRPTKQEVIAATEAGLVHTVIPTPAPAAPDPT